MKVVAEFINGQIEETDMDNSFQAHTLAYLLFLVIGTKRLKKVTIPEVDALFESRNGQVIFRATDMEWVNWLNEMKEKEE